MNIYILKNFTIQEQYLGLSDRECREAALAHRDNPDSPVGHWRGGVEKIQWGEIHSGLAPASAIAFLRALRNEPLDDGWINVFGGDDLPTSGDGQSDGEEEWLPPPED